MREIKFRAKILGHIGYVYGTPYNQHFDKEFANKWFDSMHGFDENGEVIDEYIEQETLSQFTGLYDENGKEIYEGDLLHRHMNVYWKVVFENSEWLAVGLLPDTGLYLSAYQFIECEVVGNIHENKLA